MQHFSYSEIFKQAMSERREFNQSFETKNIVQNYDEDDFAIFFLRDAK